MTAERCAEACARRGDPLVATASPVHRWLLVEQPGPWGRDAVRQSRLDRTVADVLAAKASAAGARLVLIRRPGPVAVGRPRQCALVDSRPGHEGVWWADVSHPAALERLSVADLRAGERSTDPVFLVCTHGRHDPCCAIRGRPVAAALSAGWPLRTWECSHVGGDRFAANLVVLPHGFYFGRVLPKDAIGVADRYEAGEVDPRYLRGRSSLPLPAQAAQHFARAVLAEHGIDALLPVRIDRLGHDRWRVELSRPGAAPVSVTVRSSHGLADTPLTCSATEPAAIRRFELAEPVTY